MNEKFFTKIYKLSVNYPSINLMKEYSMTAMQDFCKHAFNDRVSGYTAPLNDIK